MDKPKFNKDGINPDHISQKFLPFRFSKIEALNNNPKDLRNYLLIRIDNWQTDSVFTFATRFFGKGFKLEFDINQDRLNLKESRRQISFFPFNYDNRLK